MEETKIVLTGTAYSNYLCADLKIKILRELLMKSKTYDWVAICRCVLDIPEVADEP